MKKIIFLGGYANSGKTTSIKILRDLGIDCYSSSELLHETFRLIYKKFKGIDIDSYDKSKRFSWFTFAKNINNVESAQLTIVPIRDGLIYLAEKILIKVFGREIFAASIVCKIIKSDKNIFVIESIGGEEYILFLEFLSRLLINTKYITFNINIRRSEENPDADCRQLLPEGFHINNNKDIDTLRKNINAIIDFINIEYVE